MNDNLDWSIKGQIARRAEKYDDYREAAKNEKYIRMIFADADEFVALPIENFKILNCKSRQDFIELLETEYAIAKVSR